MAARDNCQCSRTKKRPSAKGEKRERNVGFGKITDATDNKSVYANITKTYKNKQNSKYYPSHITTEEMEVFKNDLLESKEHLRLLYMISKCRSVSITLDPESLIIEMYATVLIYCAHYLFLRQLN